MNGSQIAGSLVWNLDVDSTKFNAALDKAKNDAEKFGKHVDSNFTSLKDKISGAFESATKGSQMFASALGVVSGALVAASGFGIKYAADLETMTQGFVTLLGSAEKADAIVAKIQKDAASTPFSFKGLVSANQLLTSVTKNGDVSERFLLNIGKALTAMGKGQPELDRIIVNLQQIGAIGHANAIDLKQFAFAGIPIYDLLNEKIKGTGKNLEDMVGNGEITFTMLQDLFNQAGEGSGRFARAFELQGGTFNQVWSNFIDNLGITSSALVKQLGLFDLVKNALKGVTDVLSFFASAAGTQQIISFLQQLQQYLPIIAGIIIGGLVPAFVAWGASIWAALAPLLPFIAAGAAIGLAVKVIVDAFGGWQNAMQALQAGFGQLGNAYNQFVKPAVDALGQQLQEAAPMLKEIWGIIQPLLVPALKILGAVIGGVVIVFLRILVEYLKFLVTGFTTAYKAIKGFIDVIINLGRYLRATAADGDYANDWIGHLPGLLQGPVTAIGKFIKGLRDLGTAIRIVVDVFKGFDPGALMDDWQWSQWEGFATAVTNIREQFLGFIEFLKTIPQRVADAFMAMVQWFKNLPTLIAQSLTNTVLSFVEFLGFLTGLVIYGIPLLVSNIVAFFTALPGQIAEVFTNVYIAITTWVTNTGTWLAATIPAIVDSVVNFFASLPGRITAALTFLLTVIVGGFILIWNWLKTTVPQIIESVVTFFASLPDRIKAWLTVTKDTTSKGFMDVWDAIVAEISTWPGRLYDWGANIANAFVDGIKSAIGKIVDAFKSGLDKAKQVVKGNSPPVAGPFKDIDKWGFNVGSAWVEGVRTAIAGLDLNIPSISAAPAFAPAPAVAGPQGGSVRQGPLVNIEEMVVREQSDITDIARELGFRIELSTGGTQNG